MALSKGSSGNIGMPELIVALGEFERDNSVEIQLNARMVVAKGRRDLQWTALAFDAKAPAGEVRLLASAKYLCMESRLVTVEALLLQLLYTLDFELELNEYRSIDGTK